jgi:hypothetical protein
MLTFSQAQKAPQMDELGGLVDLHLDPGPGGDVEAMLLHFLITLASMHFRDWVVR